MDLPKRKRNRLKNYSYSQNGIYFLTVCTKDKQCILGRIVEKYVCSIEKAYSQIKVMNYVVMPNHIHLLVMLYSDNNIYRNIKTDLPANDDIPVMISALKKTN